MWTGSGRRAVFRSRWARSTSAVKTSEIKYLDRDGAALGKIARSVHEVKAETVGTLSEGLVNGQDVMNASRERSWRGRVFQETAGAVLPPFKKTLALYPLAYAERFIEFLQAMGHVARIRGSDKDRWRA